MKKEKKKEGTCDRSYGKKRRKKPLSGKAFGPFAQEEGESKKGKAIRYWGGGEKKSVKKNEFPPPVEKKELASSGERKGGQKCDSLPRFEQGRFLLLGKRRGAWGIQERGRGEVNVVFPWKEWAVW